MELAELALFGYPYNLGIQTLRLPGLDVLHVDVFTAARGQHLEGEDLLIDLIICHQLAVNDATLHVLIQGPALKMGQN